MTLILSLDDEDGMLHLLGLILELAGYEHLQTHDDDEALSLLRTRPIDLFTQDLARPGRGGVEFYRMMKADSALLQIPVLILSCSAAFQPDFVADCPSYGDDFLVKPWSPSELLTRVAALLTQHGKHVPTDEDRAARQE